MAWRTAPSRFAGPDTRTYIVSSVDEGHIWEMEHEIALGTDVREPRLLAFDGYLQLMFFETGDDPGTFEPKRLLRTRHLGPAQWSSVEVLSDHGEVRLGSEGSRQPSLPDVL